MCQGDENFAARHSAELGQERRIHGVQDESAIHPIATESQQRVAPGQAQEMPSEPAAIRRAESMSQDSAPSPETGQI